MPHPDRQPTRPGLPNVLKKTILVFGASVLAVLAAEGALRFAASREPAPVPSNTYVHYRHGYYTYPPGTSQTFTDEQGNTHRIESDDQGFRNPKQIGQQSERPVLLLGDSFLMASNTKEDETFAAHLRSLWPQRPIINAGMDGFGTFQEVLTLLHFIEIGTVPSEVVLLFYLGNDFRDNYAEADRIKRFNPAWAKDLRVPLGPRPRGFMASSRLWQRVRALSSRSAPHNPLTEYFHSELELYRKDPDEEYLQDVREATTACFRILAEAAHEHGIRLTVVLIPSKAQVYREFVHISSYELEQPAYKEAVLDLLKVGWDFDQIEQLATSCLEETGIQHVSLTPLFRQLRAEERLYHFIDRHWTERAQRLAAEYVVEWFSKKGHKSSAASDENS